MTDARGSEAEKVARATEVWPYDTEPPAGIVRTVLAYTSPGGRDVELTSFRREAQPKKPRPAMVFIHGGCWLFGDKHQFYRQSARLAEKYDMFCVSIDYRLSGEAMYPAALHDSKAAVRWVHSVAAEHNIDTSRIAVAGGSCGAHLAALVAVTNGLDQFEGDGGHADSSSDVHLAVLFNGHNDLVHYAKIGMGLSMMTPFFGGTFDEVPDLYREASPVQWATKDAPPMLFLHGDQDEGMHQSIIMAGRLKPLGVPAEVEIYKGVGHAWFNGEQEWQDTMDRVEEFLVKYFHLNG
jgi:pectinesterase